MIPAALPANETERLAELHKLGVLDTASEERLDRFTRQAMQLFDVPIALVSLVDANRQWFKSHQGVDATETPRDMSFCAHAILEKRTFVIVDALADKRFRDNPLVTGEPFIRFYAGCPLVGTEGFILGTLCIIDRRPRQLTPKDFEALREIADMVATELQVSPGTS